MNACATPQKRAFDTEQAAQDRADEVNATGRDVLEPYPCGCGFWHLRNEARYERRRQFRVRQMASRSQRWAARAQERHALGLDVMDETAENLESAVEIIWGAISFD